MSDRTYRDPTATGIHRKSAAGVCGPATTTLHKSTVTRKSAAGVGSPATTTLHKSTVTRKSAAGVGGPATTTLHKSTVTRKSCCKRTVIIYVKLKYSV